MSATLLNLIVINVTAAIAGCAFGWWASNHRAKARCMHHDRHTGQTWTKSMLVDLGMRKLVWCGRCGRDF